MNKPPHTARALCAALALAALLVACPQGDTPDELTPDDQEDYSGGYVSDVEHSLDGISLDETISVVSVPNEGVQPQSLEVQGLPSGCGTPSNNTDSDGDGIPDNATFTYDPLKCVQTLFGGGTRTLSGTVTIQDSSSTGFGYIETSDLTLIRRPSSGPTVTELRKAVATLEGNESQVVKTFNTRLDQTVQGRKTSTYVNKHSYTFKTTGAPLRFKQPMPAGTVNITGSSDWFIGTRRIRQFGVSTPVPIQYDPACRASRLVGGQQVLEQPRSKVTITYRTCGTPPKIEFSR